MSGTYGYLKAAKIKFTDTSSYLIVQPSAGQQVALKAVDLVANNLVTNTLNWNNAYVPDPSNNSFNIKTFIAGNNSEFSTMTVNGTSTFTGNVTMPTLIDTSNVSASNLSSVNLNLNNLNLNSANINNVVTSSVNANNLVLGSASTPGFLIDLSGNVNNLSLNVNGNSILNDTYVTTDTYVNVNADIVNNLAVTNNKYIGNSVYIDNVLQMYDSSGGTLDSSGNPTYTVSMTGVQLRQLLALI